MRCEVILSPTDVKEAIRRHVERMTWGPNEQGIVAPDEAIHFEIETGQFGEDEPELSKVVVDVPLHEREE